MRSQAKAPSPGSHRRKVSDIGHAGTALACLLSLIVFCGISASVALAGQTRLPVPGISPLAEPNTEDSALDPITDPNGIAIDEASGNVFVNDAGSHTEILSADGGPPAGLLSPYLATSGCSFGAFANGNGVAVDNSSSAAKGTVYVVCTNGKIRRFTRDPLAEKYVAGTEITYPGAAANASATVDANGNLFVSNLANRSVYKFNPAGSLVKTFVLPQSPVFIAVDSFGRLFYRQAGTSGPIFKCSVDAFGEIDPGSCFQWPHENATSLSLDRATDTLYVAFGNRLAQYDADTLTKEFGFGEGAVSTTRGIVVNSATDRVYVSDTGIGNDHVAAFGPPVPTPDLTTKAASEVTGTTATLNGIVNPRGVEVTACKFEYGPTTAYGSSAPCEELIPTDSIDHPVTASISGLAPNGVTYHFRLIVQSANGPANPQGGNRTLATDDTVFTEPATEVGATSATLNGTVRPEGEQLSDCFFEYGTALDYGKTAPCSPAFGSVPDDFDSHAVSGALTGLESNTTYHFRFVTTNTFGTFRGDDLAFTTAGQPAILEQRPINATQTAVTLQARINPAGSSTSYHFEWGTDASYGKRIPADHELVAGSESEPVKVQANLSGLRAATGYHFRIVVTNSLGTATGSDQPFQTLGDNGLPDNREYELVTPADKGAAASIADSFSGRQFSQASTDGESFMYPLLNGLDSSTAGGWLRLLADRSDSGWLSTQISGPALIPPPNAPEFGIAMPSAVEFISPDNSCALLESYNPLTEDTPQASIELGIRNLYRWDAEEGGYELISNEVPLNPELGGSGYYPMMEASDDCSRVYFSSRYELIDGASGLYEWDDGTLRDAGVRPDGSVGAPMGALVGRAVLGGQVNLANTGRWNAVSADGSRLFFTAISAASGKPAVFMREDGTVIEISLSESGVATAGARFEAASSDASRVVFRANYGIDAEGSSNGPTSESCGPAETESGSNPKLEKKHCDLYTYDVESGEITDLSADANPADAGRGAQIQGAVAVDDDGSHVYFAALGQLVPGKGRTYAENIAGFGSANVYLYRDNEPLSYVTTLAEHSSVGDLLESSQKGAALMRRAESWSANTSADGGELLFKSSRNLIGYETGGVDKFAAYLYSADSGRLACISCRPDGLPLTPVFVPGGGGEGSFHQSSWLLAFPQPDGYRARSISEDGSRVVFTSPDALASGAEVGKRNVYQWQLGQVTLLAVAEHGGVNGARGYLDMSADGEDVFVGTAQQLVPQDKDFISDIYDVRVDGGLPYSVPLPECQVSESAPLQPNQMYCQGARSAQPPASSPPSVGFQGEGNPAASKSRRRSCPKGKVRRRGKCRERAQRSVRRKQHRAVNTNPGGAK